MSFRFPFGLLLLLAIPVLIIIYIIKNKYKEKVVSSSYIWDLSKKFLKKKNPLNSIANLLNLIIQCVCIAFLSFSLADPVFNFQNGAENEVYILDASASMSMVNEDGETRFEEAKNQIKNAVNDSPNGSTFTLIVSDSNSRTLCKNIQDKAIFNSLLDRVEIDYGNSELTSAISLAQSLASVGEGSRFTLFTDKDIKVDEGIEAFNVADTNKNYSINDLRINDIKEEESNSEIDVVSDTNVVDAAIEETDDDIDLQDENEVIGTLEIPKLELSAPIKEGIEQEILANSIGHFNNSSIWDGNVCLASHNRGDSVKHYFDRINELVNGDTIIYKTKLGERSYQVIQVKEIENTDWSITESKTNDKNTITLVTCITNQPEKRLCVIAEEKNN